MMVNFPHAWDVLRGNLSGIWASEVYFRMPHEISFRIAMIFSSFNRLFLISVSFRRSPIQPEGALSGNVSLDQTSGSPESSRAWTCLIRLVAIGLLRIKNG